MAKVKGKVRTNQAVTTYGVGSLVAAGDEAFIVAGLDRWPVDAPDIEEPRLVRTLRSKGLAVSGFARPPATEEGDIPVIRFPQMHYCPGCHRLDTHSRLTRWDDNRCSACPDEPELVPSRFVVCCQRGHIGDFPYFQWVHAGSRPSGEKRTHRLSFKAAGLTASLRDIVIECSCGEAATMDGAFGKEALAEFGRCPGHRPWLDAGDQECDLVPRTIQRGASNGWFALVDSALSIPPWSEAAFKLLGRQWKMLRNVPDNALEAVIEGYLADQGLDDEEFSVTDVAAAVRQRLRQEAGDDGEPPLRSQEYQALLKGRAETTVHQDFVCTRAPITSATEHWFERVMTVTKLREVRVLTGFTRLFPPGQGDIPLDDQTAALSAEDVGWLPAIEVIGEGVFLTLNRDRLRDWEQRRAAIERGDIIDGHYRDRAERFGRLPDRAITPRFILAHTLAHALIDEWALDCGYPTASLRERLYVDDDHAGLLIYTATSDSAGSLGGVVAMAAPDRLEQSLTDAVRRASWCSADPLCLEAGTQGVDSLNLAACHACVLLPETSCEEMNTLLDRATLVGTAEHPELGYFADLVS